MKARDVILQLQLFLPQHTNLFSDVMSVDSLMCETKKVTCVTKENHGLSNGELIYVRGAITPVRIVELSCKDGIITAVTNADHDLTDGYQKYVTINGADQPIFNGKHEFIHQDNRFIFTCKANDKSNIIATGDNIYLLSEIRYGYNGPHRVTVLDSKTISYDTSRKIDEKAQGEIVLIKNHRISGANNLDRILESYTKQAPNKMWMFVTLDNATASKDRYTLSDATALHTSGQDVRQRVIAPFSIYVIVPTSNKLTPLDIKDNMDDLAKLVYRAILNWKIPSTYTDQTSFGVSFVEHGEVNYSYAYYVHFFRFESYYDLIREDCIDTDDSVALRDIILSFNNDNMAQIMYTDVNLDDNPVQY